MITVVLLKTDTEGIAVDTAILLALTMVGTTAKDVALGEA
jgi:hypothetical protein